MITDLIEIVEIFMDNYFDDEAENEFFVILNACYGHYL